MFIQKTALTSFSILILMASAISAYAQPPHEKPNFHAFAQQVGLDENQTSQFLTVINTHHENRKMMANTGRENLKNSLKNILTPDQMAAFKAFMEASRAHSPPQNY